MTKAAHLILLLFCCLHLQNARAAILDVNLLSAAFFTNGGIPKNITDEAVRMLGVYTVHRPYTGATSIISSNTMDIMVEGTAVKVGDELIQALKANGLSTGGLSTSAAPMAKISARKAFSNRVDLGVSGIVYKSNRVYGGDVKIVLHEAEEGLSYAMRLGYTYARVPTAYLESSSTYTAELVASQKLYFAEPYIGVGGHLVRGTLSITENTSVSGIPISVNVKGSGGGSTGYAFTGVFFRIFGSQGLRLALEGTYDISGYSAIGTSFGLGF